MSQTSFDRTGTDSNDETTSSSKVTSTRLAKQSIVVGCLLLSSLSRASADLALSDGFKISCPAANQSQLHWSQPAVHIRATTPPYIYADPTNGLRIWFTLSCNTPHVAANLPVVLDVKIENCGERAFHADESDQMNNRAVFTPHTMPTSKADNRKQIMHDEMMWTTYSLGPGKQKTFHILLNDLVELHPGNTLCGWLRIPLHFASHELAFVSCPLSLVVGPDATEDESRIEAKMILRAIAKETCSNDGPEGLHYTSAFNDRYALPILEYVISKESDLTYNAECELSHRPLTAAVRKELFEIANLREAGPNDFARQNARRYLSDHPATVPQSDKPR